MRTILFLVAGLAGIAASSAPAADLRVMLVDAAGRPVAGAVVSAYPAAGVPATAARPSGPFRMAQQDISFKPGLLIVPVGATVAFPNLDKVRHHVYSFSTAKKFELKLYGRDETHSVTFDKPGTVALGCNIHDAMNGFIRVVDTPFAAASDATGSVQIAGLPAGQTRLRIWQRNLRARGNEQEMSIAIPAAGLRQVVRIAVPG